MLSLFPNFSAIYQKLFSSPYKKMADWVKSKSGKWSSLYTLNSMATHRNPNVASDSTHHSADNSQNGTFQNGQSVVKRNIILPDRPFHPQQHSKRVLHKVNGNSRRVVVERHDQVNLFIFFKKKKR